MTEHDLDLPVTAEITWHDFEQLALVKDLLLMNPTMRLHDVTPDGMPDRFTEDEWTILQKANMLDSGQEFTYNEEELDT